MEECRLIQLALMTVNTPFDPDPKPGPDPTRALIKSLNTLEKALDPSPEPVDRLKAFTMARSILKTNLEWFDKEIKIMQTNK